MRFGKQLQEFLKSNSDFAIVYRSPTFQFADPNIKRILVLDSSFNPPHLAHYALAEEARTYKFGDSDKDGDRLLLLLLSVKNADKIYPSPALFDERLEMMYIMARVWEKKTNVPVSIGLTNHAKFVDKSVAITLYIKAQLNNQLPSTKLTFLVGYDTLERILDPKYYLPDLLLDSLNEFMKTTDLFCLTRSENVEAYNEQVDFIRKIHHGDVAHIPQAWSNSVHLRSVGSEREVVGQINSTNVRNAFAQGNATGNLAVLPEIKAYIEENGIYKSKD